MEEEEKNQCLCKIKKERKKRFDIKKAYQVSGM